MTTKDDALGLKDHHFIAGALRPLPTDHMVGGYIATP